MIRYKAIPYISGTSLGVYCSSFQRELAARFPELSEKLQLLVGRDGKYTWLQLTLVCPLRVQRVELEINVIESVEAVFIIFNGAQKGLASPQEADEALKRNSYVSRG